MTTFKLTELRSMPAIKKAAYKGPVMLTEHGSTEFVLLTIGDFNELKKKANNNETTTTPEQAS